MFSIGGDESVNVGAKKDNRFNAVVKFIGPFTLQNGSATHKITLPMYVGSVRVMLIAAHGAQYGNAEKTVPVRSPLMVLPTLPRVIGTGEKVTLPVNVFALEDGVKNANVSVKVEGPLKITGSDKTSLSFDKPGEYGELVDDPLASDGRAIKMFNSHHQWCAMLMMNRIAFEPGVKYRLRARLRCAATARGNAFTAGVFDERTWKLAGQVSVRADRMSPDYVWYDICTFVPNDGEYFWIAPGGLNKDGDKNANAVLLDKISFEPGCVDATLPSVYAGIR